MAKNSFFREENLRLTREVRKLERLNRLAREIGDSLDTDSIMDRIIQFSREEVDAEQAAINVLSNDNPGDRMGTLARSMGTSTNREKFHLSYCLLGWMHENKRPFLSNSPWTDKRIRGLKPDESIHSILCVPLMMRAELVGVLSVYNKENGNGFTDEDQSLLGIIALQSAEVVENAIKSDELSRIHAELNHAAQVQREILPKEAPHIPGYDISGASYPAEEVGGDYFDFIPIDDNRVAVCLGDASGHGLPAALLIANLQAAVRAQTMNDLPVGDLITHANHLIYENTDSETFVTFFCGVLDIGAQEFRFSNAGHEYPILFSSGTSPKRLAIGGTPLGVLDDFQYGEDITRIEKGDLIIMYSDGITEAFDVDDNEFGEEKLIEFVERHRDDTSLALINRIMGAVKEHAGSEPQADDRTLVVIKRVAA